VRDSKGDASQRINKENYIPAAIQSPEKLSVVEWAVAQQQVMELSVPVPPTPKLAVPLR